MGGRAADLFGRRRMFAGSLGLFVAASAACAVAPSGLALVAARGVQGLAGALLSPSSLSILLTTFTGQRERNRALGVRAGLPGLGAATGLLLGGSLIELFSWRWVFFLNVPVGLIALAAVPAVIARGGERNRVAADFAGAALITAALLLFVFTIVETDRHSWGSARTVLGLAGAAVLGIAFVLRQRAAAEPLMPGALLRMRNVVTADALAFVAASGLFAMSEPPQATPQRTASAGGMGCCRRSADPPAAPAPPGGRGYRDIKEKIMAEAFWPRAG